MHIEVHAEIIYLHRTVDKGFFCPKRLSEIREVFTFQKKCKYLPICCLLILFQKPPERLLAFRFLPLKLCWQWKPALLRIWTFSMGEDGVSAQGSTSLTWDPDSKSTWEVNNNCPHLGCHHFLCPRSSHSRASTHKIKHVYERRSIKFLQKFRAFCN